MSDGPSLSELGVEREELRARHRALTKQQREAAAEAAVEPPKPVSASERSQNRLRPERLADVIGQPEATELVGDMIRAAKARSEPLDHVLLLGPAGTGKTTFANVIANELGTRCFQMAAPVALDVLLELRGEMNEGDILFVDEIHQQAIMERRGKESISSPEVWLSLLEDFVLATKDGMVPFPRITVIGATTDPGRLPDPFLDRFPIEPVLEPYSKRALELMAERNAHALGLTLMPEVAGLFAGAARRTPRILNNYVKNAESLVGSDGYVVREIAERVLFKLNRVTADGLTRHMQAMLRFMYEKCERHIAGGEVRYQASINTIATAIGLSRDTKAVQLRVEPYLIQAGYVQLGSGGRLLTHDGIWRARELQEGKSVADRTILPPCPVCGASEWEVVLVQPVCDFCSEPFDTEGECWTFPCESFEYPFVAVELQPGHANIQTEGSDDAWAACDTCHDLIEDGDRVALAKRSVKKDIERHPEAAKERPMLMRMTRAMQDGFFKHRNGEAIQAPVRGGNPT